MLDRLKLWMERALEKPFFDAEMIRVEILKGDNTKRIPISKNMMLRLREIHH